MDLKIQMVAKDMFFDRKKIVDLVGRANKKAISHAAALVRSTAKQSMRTVKNPNKKSQPGKPPFAHTKRIKNSILYGYNESSGSAVIGPSASYGVNDVPALHEFGGRQRVRKISHYAIYVGKKMKWGGRIKTMKQAEAAAKYLNKNNRKKHERYYFVLKDVPKMAKYPARPFMRPALTKMVPKIRTLYPKTFGDAWKASV